MSARAPYGVLCYDLVWKQTPPGTIVIIDYWAKECKVYGDEPYRPIEEFRMYLRPMSSMTEEEKKELNNILEYQYYSDDSKMCESTDWLYANHFDFRGLIPMGLAIEAPKDLYTNEEFDSAFIVFEQRNQEWKNNLSDSTYYELAEWYDEYLGIANNESLSDKAYEFAKYVWRKLKYRE